MKTRLLVIILCITTLFCLLAIGSNASQSSDDILILYENDVHCMVEGYSKLSALKKELLQSYSHVGVVSSGDFVQGSSLGVISKGEYIVDLMNLVGYDAVALGNHEFDYTISRLDELVEMMNTKPLSANFQKIGEEEPYYQPYSIVSYGEVDIAYIGITTPRTLAVSSPSQFKDEEGNYIYTFNPTNLCNVVQKYVDAAIAEGADYVIALSHLGDAEKSNNVGELIENTTGIDVVLDAHSHSVIEQKILVDKEGNQVILSSTGTKFEHIGKLTISNGEIKTELIKTTEYLNTDYVIDAYIQEINEDFSDRADRPVAESLVDLITHDEDNNRLIRSSETNLGDLCADAFRNAQGADIGYINGGSIRKDIKKGIVTYNHLLDVLPHNNTIVLSEIDGQTLRELLEMAMMSWPDEGSFPHLSGLKFSLNTKIPSSVVIDENEQFVEVAGEYRVYDMMILNRESGEYEPVDLEKSYTIASNSYYLIDFGSGMKMLEKTKVINNDGILDVEALESYILEELGGVIGDRYRKVDPNITFTDGNLSSKEDELSEAEEAFPTLLVVGISLGAVVVASLTVTAIILIRKKTTVADVTQTPHTDGQ